MKKFVCSVCGYVYEGETAPDFCPICKAPKDKFVEQVGEMKLAAEHEFGIYAKTVKNNPDISAEDKKYIFDQLMANFNGECSEVGMYLCMARIAHREGYPEIGLYWEKAAFEEAEHAAKFAELLGEELEPNMKASTKENLAWRVRIRRMQRQNRARHLRKEERPRRHSRYRARNGPRRGSSRPRPEGLARPLLRLSPKRVARQSNTTPRIRCIARMRGVFNKGKQEKKPWRKKDRAQKRATLRSKNPWSRFTALTKELPGAMPFAPFCAT